MLTHWRLAFTTQIILITTLLSVCWSRFVFEPWAIAILLKVIAFTYLISTLACLVVKVHYSYKNWLAILGFVVICSLGLTSGFIYKHYWLGVDIYFVPTPSMFPTLKPGEFILVDTWAYAKYLPQEKDVVVFQQNSAQLWLVKRIATWPDGSLMNDSKFYLLGDNANASEDSRYFVTVHSPTY